MVNLLGPKVVKATCFPNKINIYNTWKDEENKKNY